MTTPLLIGVAGFLALVGAAGARAALERRPRAQAAFGLFGRLEVGVVVLLLGTLVALGAVQIILRNFFHAGLLWADPLMRHITLWLGAMGAALASSHMRHITVDVFSRLLPPRWKAVRRALVWSATALASYTLAVAAARLVVDERQFGDPAFLGIPTWVMQLILPASFALIAYRSLLAIFLRREPAEAGSEI